MAHNLEHLRTFLVVVRAGSLSEAARLLGISQPTASSHVHALEERLGFRLFERTPSGMTATPKAVALAQDVAAHVDALDDLAHLSAVPGFAEVVHLGGPAEFLTAMILPHLAQLTELAAVRVRFGLADALLEQLRAGQLDLVVSAIQPRVAGVAGAPLADEEFLLVAAASWRSVGDSPEQLATIPVIAYAENLPIVRRYWRSVFGRRPDDLDVRAVIPDLRSIRAALVGGAGMSVLPRYLVEEELASGALVLLDHPEVPPLNTIYLASRTGELERNPRLRDLAARVRLLSRAPR